MHTCAVVVGNKTILMDAKHIPLIVGRRIFINPKGYAYININGKREYIHRLVANTPKGASTDHINGDVYDNRECNLRICNSSQNRANAKVVPADRKKGNNPYKGVYCAKKRYHAHIRVDGRKIHLGTYLVAEDAAYAYDEAARHYFGEFARTNQMLGLLPPRNTTTKSEEAA